MGVAEIDRFRRGTLAVARAVVDSPAHTVVGGGDSVAALQALGIRRRHRSRLDRRRRVAGAARRPVSCRAWRRCVGESGPSAAGRGVLITGNWKMNLLRAPARELAAAVVRELDTGGRLRAGVRVAVAPPYTALDVVRDATRGSGVLLAAQDVAATTEGAYTGEVAAAMLADAGVELVIVGHSERRHGLGDTDDVVLERCGAPARRAWRSTLCVGETSDERDAAARRKSLRGRCVR